MTRAHCKSKALADEFLELAKQFDYYRDENPYNDYKENTCFRVETDFNGIDFVDYCDLNWYKEQGTEIVEFKSTKQNWAVAVEDITLEMLPEVIRKVLKVEVNEEFKLNIKGSLAYRINKDLIVEYLENYLWIQSSITLQDLILGGIKIVEIPPKPLLTDAEREFLSNFEFDKLEANGYDASIDLYDERVCVNKILLRYCKHKFDGLERDRTHTRKELGLETRKIYKYNKDA